ncbi:RHS repeat-associated core domain-containing protein, partial [Streptococcus azizii]
EDSFHYYEERNYVNDVNRKHTEVLQTYDRELKARETYTYGQGRSSYHNHGTGDTYQYLTNQAGSVTGLTKDGQAVASSKYQLYGSTKDSTDETGNPYAYNGEARDGTGLDYLRARYYDSQAGTFLTEDSYQGELDDPLSQNRYSYVHNNPVNYTDPSGHFWKSIKRVASNAWNGVKRAAGNAWNAWNATKTFVGNAWNATKEFVGNAWNATKTFVGNAWNTATNWFGNQVNGVYQAGQQVYHSASSYAQAQYQQMQAQVQAQQLQAVRHEYAQATGIKGTPKSREARNLLRNWGAALAKTLRHVCTTAKRVGKQIVKAVKKIDWKKVAVTAGAIGVGVALTVATGGLGAPIAMAIGGAASGAIISGYDAYSSGKRGWALAGAIGKGAGLGAITGLVGGSVMGAGSGIATSITQNIGNQTVRHIAKAGIEAGIETAIDTGLDVATGNQITGQTVAMNFAYNLVSNGAGSVSPKKAPKAEVNTTKPKAGDVPVTKANTDEYVTYRRVQGGGKGTATSQPRINVNSDGTISISKHDKDLNISIDNGEHSAYYLQNKRPGGEIVEFEVPKWMDDFRKEYTVPQTAYKINPNNQGGMAPKVTDITTPGRSIEFPAPWVEWIEEYAVNARVVKGN